MVAGRLPFDLGVTVLTQDDAVGTTGLGIVQLRRAPGRITRRLEVQLPTERDSIAVARFGELARLVDRDGEGFQPVGPMHQRNLADVIGPQAGRADLPTVSGSDDPRFHDSDDRSIRCDDGGAKLDSTRRRDPLDLNDEFGVHPLERPDVESMRLSPALFPLALFPRA